MSAGHPYEENELAERFRQGEESAFTQVYNQFHADIVFFAWRFTGAKQEAEDITSRAFTSLWQKRSTVQGTGQMKAFLHVVAKNACLDYLKAQKIRTARQQELYTLLLEGREENGFAEHQYNALLFTRIHEEIEKLPPQCRKIFKLAYLEEMKNREIAVRLGISPATVKNQKLRAVQLLKAALGQSLGSILFFLKFL